MATEVVEEEVVLLEDDTKVTIRPLVIGRLRKFMKTWNTWIEDLETFSSKREANAAAVRDGKDEIWDGVPKLSEISDKEYDVYVDLAVICLSKELQNEMSDKKFRDYLEDNLNQAVMYRTFSRCAGLDLRTNENENLTNLMGEME